MKRKEIIQGIVVAAVIAICGYVLSKHVMRVNYVRTAICKEKFPQYRQTSQHNYFVILQYENGRIEEKECTVEEYTSYKVNEKYSFTKTKYVWY